MGGRGGYPFENLHMEYFIKASVSSSFLNLWMFGINKWSKLRKFSKLSTRWNFPTWSIQQNWYEEQQILTNISNWGSFLVAYASSSVRGSNDKLSVVVKGPDAMIYSNTKIMHKSSTGPIQKRSANYQQGLIYCIEV